jgi:hypothetical protein
MRMKNEDLAFLQVLVHFVFSFLIVDPGGSKPVEFPLQKTGRRKLKTEAACTSRRGNAGAPSSYRTRQDATPRFPRSQPRESRSRY